MGDARSMAVPGAGLPTADEDVVAVNASIGIEVGVGIEETAVPGVMAVARHAISVTPTNFSGDRRYAAILIPSKSQ